MAIKVLAGMNVADAVVLSAGSMEDLVAFCQLNGIGITDDLTPGEILQSTGLIYQAASVITNSQLTAKPVLILPGQTMADLAIQHMGSMEAIFTLAVLNGAAITDDLQPGLTLNCSLLPYSQLVYNFFNSNKSKPASGLNTPNEATPVLMAGIGYWAIGFDFIVS